MIALAAKHEKPAALLIHTATPDVTPERKKLGSKPKKAPRPAAPPSPVASRPSSPPPSGPPPAAAAHHAVGKPPQTPYSGARAFTTGDGRTLLLDAQGNVLDELRPFGMAPPSECVPDSRATLGVDEPANDQHSPINPPARPHGGGPLGKANAAILADLIRRHVGWGDDLIARDFAAATGRVIQASTVETHRRKLGGGGTTIDPSSYEANVAKMAIKLGADRRSVRDSDEFGDGMMGLTKAIAKHADEPVEHFPSYATKCIRNEILAGRGRREGKAGSAKRAGGRATGSLAMDPPSRSDHRPEIDLGPDERELIERRLHMLTDRERQIVIRRLNGETFPEIARSVEPRVGPNQTSNVYKAAVSKVLGAYGEE